MSDTALRGLLTAPPRLVTEGIGLFDEALAAQAAHVTRVDWTPPIAETVAALPLIAADPRTADANAEAVRRLLTATPHLVGVSTASQALGLGDRSLLHAGPPIDWDHASGPLRGAIVGALLYEGIAGSPEDAMRIAGRGEIDLSPCHHRHAVGPMAGVVSPSMPVWVVRDGEYGGAAYCTINEGLGKVLRYGAYDSAVIRRLHWIERVLGPMLAAALARRGPVDMRALVAQALHMGDEGHNRNRAGTSLFIREIVEHLVASDAASSEIVDVLQFLNSNDHFLLNLVMPAAKATADAARNIPGSTMIVAMARNGTEFGVQTAGTGDRWFTAAAEVPDGLFLGGYTVDDANPDIGDSTITETVGIGGFAMAAAPAIVRFVGGRVDDALRCTEQMYEITLAEHGLYQIPALDFRGTPTGIDVTKIARTGIVPAVNTGIAGKESGTGQVGAGLVSPPIACFAAAVRALADAAMPPISDRGRAG